MAIVGHLKMEVREGEDAHVFFSFFLFSVYIVWQLHSQDSPLIYLFILSDYEEMPHNY